MSLDLSHVRAVRNNNPGNIRVGINWHGLMDHAHMDPPQAAEKEFCVFQTPADGFRAMATIFHTYYKDHAIRTVRAAITRWAPPSENNTAAYVDAVAKYLRCGADDPYPFLANAAMMELCHAVSVHEVGGWFFNGSDLVAGVNAAH